MIADDRVCSWGFLLLEEEVEDWYVAGLLSVYSPTRACFIYRLDEGFISRYSATAESFLTLTPLSLSPTSFGSGGVIFFAAQP
jgi:hypothetical protein